MYRWYGDGPSINITVTPIKLESGYNDYKFANNSWKDKKDQSANFADFNDASNYFNNNYSKGTQLPCNLDINNSSNFNQPRLRPTAPTPEKLSPSEFAKSQFNTMPVGSVQGQNSTQGLVHWMSAVMAEHMTGQPHHDPSMGMHYMWNGGVEAKLSDHHNIQKAHMLDDSRMDHHHQSAQSNQMALYTHSGVIRGGAASNSNSPVANRSLHNSAATTALLVVPQPINATKVTNSLANSGNGRKYQCKMCPQIFSSKADLQLHTQIHMREAKPYKCSQCAKAFANSSYLSQHTRIHLGIKPYRCEICQRKFTQLSHLQQHIRTHTGDKPYKCRHPGCQKAFSQLSNLQSHSRCHQTDKPFKCNSCYKSFSDEHSLLEHIPKHKESKHLKTHICQYCGKSYTQETYLTKHMQKHAERTDKRPPIKCTSHNAATAAMNNNRNLSGLGTLLPPPPSSVTGGADSYWPKVSPDSANVIEAMHQQQQSQHPSQQHLASHHDFPAISAQQAQLNNNSQQQIDIGDMQAHHRMLENGSHAGRNDVVTSPTGILPYDSFNLPKSTNNSAFTPINSMTPHLNTLGHHAMTQRPSYLYDAISFQNKNPAQNGGNAPPFPNQLISLHQIRNYAQQPPTFMAGEHLLGVSVGGGGSAKDKG